MLRIRTENLNTPEYWDNLYRGAEPRDDPERYGAIQEFLRQQQFQGRVADLGCGRGELLKQLAQAGYATEVWGYDHSQVGLDIAAREYPEGNWVWYDIEKLPCEDAFFDLVCCIQTLEHVEFPAKLVYHVFRILRGGGLAIFSIPLDRQIDHESHVWSYGMADYKFTQIFGKVVEKQVLFGGKSLLWMVRKKS